MASTLVCPSCDAAFGEAERFCPHCGIPLVPADAQARTERPPSRLRERVRKVKPQYSEGELVTVARAGNQAEAEMIQGLLLEEGIPSMLRRSMGFDTPGFIAGGPRDVLVPQSGAAAAHDVLAPSDGASGGAGDAREV